MSRAGEHLLAIHEGDSQYAIRRGSHSSPRRGANAKPIIGNEHEQKVVFTPALRLKDVDYALKLAGRLGIGTPFGRLAESQFRRLCDLGHTRANESKILEVARLQTPEA